MYAITRLKAARNAWYFAVHFKRRAKFYFRRFYDLKLGRPKKFKAAAVAWRDRMLASAKVLTKRESYKQRRSNNTSVCAGRAFHQAGQAAFGHLAGEDQTGRRQSVLKFGERQAYRKVVAARREMLENLDDQPYLYDATAKALSAKSGADVPRRRTA